MAKTREEIEAKRGIVRDNQGRIVRDKNFHKDAIERLKVKRSELDLRAKNIDKQIKSHEDALKAGAKSSKTK